ncbi:MAG: gamma-glutamyltransferase [Bdellovibrionota bacterium]
MIEGKSWTGIYSVAVPGLIAGLFEIHEKFGKLPWSAVVAPAITLAKQGVVVTDHLSESITAKQDELLKYPLAKQRFFTSDGKALPKKSILQQPELAQTLEAIAKHGKDGFYKGWVAQATIAQSQKLGGMLTHKDLTSYEVQWRTPVKGQFEGQTILSMPPPSSGGIHVVQILKAAQPFLHKEKGAMDPDNIHYTALAMQHAFADRAKYLGDSDHVEVPMQGLLDPAYISDIQKRIKSGQTPAMQVSHIDPFMFESNDTTHFSMIDAEGNAIASTQTINGRMGSGVIVDQAGYLLNNEMDDFVSKPGVPNAYGAVGNDKNAIAPGKRPLSSMSPTIVLDQNSKLCLQLDLPVVRVLSIV